MTDRLPPSSAISAVFIAPDFLRLSTPEGTFTVQPLTPNTLRIRLAPPHAPQKPSRILLPTPRTPFNVDQSPAAITLKTAAATLRIDRATAALTLLDPAGNTLLAERPGPRLAPSPILDDALQATASFHSPTDEHLLGTGQFQDGFLNLRDLPRRLTQVNSQIALPFLLSSKGYGLFWHQEGMTELNPADQCLRLVPTSLGPTTQVEVTSTEGTMTESRTDQVFAGEFATERPGRHALLLDVGSTMARRHTLAIDGTTLVDQRNHWLPPTTSLFVDLPAGTHRVEVVGEADDRPVLHHRPAGDVTTLRSPVSDGLDFLLVAGDPATCLRTLHQLTGHAPLMPRWALGYIHCRERFRSQQELLDNAAEFRARRIPVDTIVQDWQYWGRHGWNAMKFDAADYPAPKAMVDALHAQNLRLMLSVWSRIDPSSKLGKQAADQHFYIPGTQWIDFFNPAAAAFYWEHFSARLADLGIDAWWLDAPEPENDDLAGRTTFEGHGERTRLAYPFLVNRTVYQGLRKDFPDRRPFILTRSAFLGQQRFAAATWSGDIGNDWETLRRQIPAGLHMAAAGQPYWTTDCGGFFRPGPSQFTDPAYHERFIRWFQYATFCPLTRVHGYQTNTEPWRYGPTVELAVRRFLDLRYRLLPYLYSQTWQVTTRGAALMRPLLFDFPQDPQALAQSHQYMFGPSILVAPVFEPGVTQWPAYLPRDTAGWTDFWTGVSHAPGQRVHSPATLDTLPLYLRAGAILPLGPATQDATNPSPDPIELRIVPGADGAFTLYEDDGHSNAYEQGERTQIPIAWHDASRTLTIGPPQGRPTPPRTFHVVLIGPDHGTGIAPCRNPDAILHYAGAERVLHLP